MIKTKKKYKVFQVGIWEEQGGYVSVSATSKLKAEEKILELLMAHGFDYLQKEFNVATTHRDCNLI